MLFKKRENNQSILIYNIIQDNTSPCRRTILMTITRYADQIDSLDDQINAADKTIRSYTDQLNQVSDQIKIVGDSLKFDSFQQ